jgi:hypothetical protein
MTAEGIRIATRMREWRFNWPELEKICLARSGTAEQPRLQLVFLPKDRSLHPVEINLMHGSTPLRARSYVIKEITKLFGEPEYTTREALGLHARKTVAF